MTVGELAQSLHALPVVPHVVTVGSFDGVHRGHQHLLKRVVEIARESGVPSLAITFEPLPAEVLRPDLAPSRISTVTERVDQMFRAGIDRVVRLTFDQELASQSAEDFLSDVCRFAQPKAIVVGEDFAFGHRRQGNVAMLADRASEFGYVLEVMPRHNPDDAFEWSSSAIRKAIGDLGDVAGGRRILGRAFRLSGTVTNGDHRGRTLGYPTANLSIIPNLLIPADGIYAAYASGIDGRDTVPALVYVGTRPTFGGDTRVVEAFLLDFENDLYDFELTLDFVDRIRGDRAFNTADELVEQMKLDEIEGRRIFDRVAATG